MTKLAVLVGSSLANFLRNPSSADYRRHLPLWEGFWVPQKTNAQSQPTGFQVCTTCRRTDCHTSDVGHWFAMTVETLETYATTQPLTSHHAGYSFSANVFAALRAVRMSPAEAVLANSVSVFAWRKRLVSA